MVQDVFGEWVLPEQADPRRLSVRTIVVTPEMQAADARARAAREEALRAPSLAWRERLQLKVSASEDPKVPVHYVFPEGRSVAARKPQATCACGTAIFRAGREQCSRCRKKKHSRPCTRCSRMVRASEKVESGLCWQCRRDDQKEARVPGARVVRRSGRLCSAEGCDVPLYSNNRIGLCREHATVERTAQRRRAWLRCSVEGCEEQVRSDSGTGLCCGHRRELRRAEAKALKASLPPKVERLCSVDGCDAVLRGDNRTGLCWRHAERARLQATRAEVTGMEVEREMEGGRLDVLKSKTIRRNEIPVALAPVRKPLGRLGTLWAKLQALGPDEAEAVESRDNDHASLTIKHMRDRAKAAGKVLGVSRNGTTAYLWLEEAKGKSDAAA